MKRRFLAVAAVGLLSLLLLVSLMLMSAATQDSERFGRLYSALLIINALGLASFVVLIAANLRRLVRQLRQGRPGSRLTLRMLTLFVVLAVIPVLVVYGFSLDFLRRGIDSWFDVKVEQALNDALDLSRSALDLRMRELLRQTQQLAYEIAEGTEPPAPLNLEDLRRPASTEVVNVPSVFNLDALRTRLGADELTLLTLKGGMLASTSGSTADIVPNLPGEAILLQLRQGRSYIGLDPIRDTGLQVRVAVNIPDFSINAEPRVLQALFPISARMDSLAETVESAYVEYKELAYLREQLKISFTMTLTLVLLFAIFSAVWAAFYSARRLAAPIRDLVEGTQAVAAGDYSTQLPISSHDDLGFLVGSFNDMTRRIAMARDEAKRSRDQVDAQRAYLEAVLGRLSSGVLTLDGEGRLRTANHAAGQILGVALGSLVGRPVDAMASEHLYLQPLVDAIRPHLSQPRGDWREQTVLFGTSGRQVLMCRGTALAGSGSGIDTGAGGHVIVFDDVTALIQGQRDAAWSEVARRLAHEIKNPLTPIQLSAERLRHKYLKSMSGADAEVLDRLTHTIVQQVETMKEMVNTFSDYARTPQMQLQRLDLNRLVEEVLDLYRSMDSSARIELELDANLPALEADPGRLRQVLNNLVKNALEARDGGGPVRIAVSTRWVQDSTPPYVELRIDDCGPGIPQEILDRIFEPYVTTKPKGTGLGLAIVRKIIEELGGMVWLENNAGGGASAYIRLPVGDIEQAAAAADLQRRDAV